MKEAFSQLEIRISCDGKERVLDSTEDFENFVRIFCEGIVAQYTQTVSESILNEASFREDGLQVSISLRSKDAEAAPFYPMEFWVAPDGQVWQMPDSLSVWTGRGIGQLYMTFRACFVTHTQERFSFDEIVSYLER